MVLSFKKYIFLFLLACFQILLFFTLSTSYELIIISLFMVFLLFYFYYFKLKIVISSKVGLLWLGLLLSLFISSLFTHSLALSLDALVFHTASFCIFIFFRSLGEVKLFLKSEIVSVFLLAGLALSAFFITFFVFPDLATFLSPTNIFTLNYGHSHFAALLLFLIPLGWWFVFSKKYVSFRFKQSTLVLFYALLVFTFGRFAIFLSLVQIPFIYNLVKKKKNKKIYLYLTSLFLFFVMVLILFFSLRPSSTCPTKKFKHQVCKSFSKERRFEYFNQALLGFKSYPLFGYGPGTFPLITRKFNVVAHYGSTYTHNAFLQIFVESGIFTGIIYFLLIIFLFKNMFLAVRQSNKENKDDSFLLNTLILIGLIAILINSLVDFDWNLFAVYQASIMFVAIVLWDYPKNKKIKSLAIFKFFWIILVTILIFFGIINTITKTLIINDRGVDAFAIFPYFYSQSKAFLLEGGLTSDQRQYLYKIYENHDEFILKNIKESDVPEVKIELYEKLIKVNPFQTTNKKYYQVLKDFGDYKKLGEVSHRGLSLLIEIEEGGLPQSYESKRQIIDYLLVSVHAHRRKQEYRVADKYYDDIWDIWNE